MTKLALRTVLTIVIGWLFAILFSFNASARGLHGEIKGFSLSSCGVHYCLKISAPDAFLSSIDGGIALSSAKINLLPKNKRLRAITLESTDTYLDMNDHRLYVYDVVGQPNQSMLYNLKTDAVQYITK